MTDPVAVLIAEAETILEAARVEKRAVSIHRRKLHGLMERLTEIRAECARLGINLQITETPRRSE